MVSGKYAYEIDNHKLNALRPRRAVGRGEILPEPLFVELVVLPEQRGGDGGRNGAEGGFEVGGAYHWVGVLVDRAPEGDLRGLAGEADDVGSGVVLQAIGISARMAARSSGDETPRFSAISVTAIASRAVQASIR